LWRGHKSAVLVLLIAEAFTEGGGCPVSVHA
jgi:hypothetical protein